jgi:hypothetical protein
MKAVELIQQFLEKAEDSHKVKFSNNHEPWITISNKQKWFLIKLLKDEDCYLTNSNDDLIIPFHWVKDCDLKGHLWLRKIRTPDVWSIRFQQHNPFNK